MRTLTVLCTLLSLSSALAWTPVLDETSAKTVIDGVYGRAAAQPTYQTTDLSIKDGAFVTPGAVGVFDGGESCLSQWQAAP
ncbi:hypothetical protein ACFP81_05095 [Deinococcus lacus]|uniref:Uncharacterized protein n=1 Tax=Deinococcus lacus TaxID=392561 RepID=A0ABW1YBC3_9DEIO